MTCANALTKYVAVHGEVRKEVVNNEPGEIPHVKQSKGDFVL